MGKHAFWTASFQCLAKSLAERMHSLYCRAKCFMQFMFLLNIIWSDKHSIFILVASSYCLQGIFYLVIVVHSIMKCVYTMTSHILPLQTWFLIEV